MPFATAGSAALLGPHAGASTDASVLSFTLPLRVRFPSSALPVASLALGARKEPATGFEYPGDLCFVGSRKDCPQLTGFG
jgi:hypothetical protein